MSRIIARLFFTAVAAIAAGVLAVLAFGASPALAAGGPSSSAQATVTVAQSISFAFTSGTSFTLSPGITDNNAVAFNVQTNDSHGYTISLAAPDLTTGAATIPATDLSYSTFSGGAQVGNTDTLTNTAAVFVTTTLAPSTAGDSYSQNWLATIPSNTAPGSYSTTLTFVATGN